MPPQDHNPDKFEDVPRPDESRLETGEFTRAFGGKPTPPNPADFSLEDSPTPAPGSLTQLFGDKSKKPSLTPADKPDQPPPAVPNPPEARPGSSFTSAFDGVNAFTRDPAEHGKNEFHLGGGKPYPTATPSESSGSFTRLFGSGEGALTPTGGEERPRPGPVRDLRPLAPSQPTEPGAGGFTEAFRTPSVPEPSESKGPRGSFTEEFGAPSAWPPPETLPHSTSARPSVSRPGGLPTYNAEPVLPSTPQRPQAPAGGFTRLIDPLKSEPATPADATLSSMRSPRPPEYPLAEPNYAPSGSGSPPGATVVFNPSGQPEPEVAAPRGKSEYTMVVERSRLRPPVEVPGAGGSPYGAGAPAAPPAPPQYQQFTPPAPPAWQPPVAPIPPWQPPQMAPPAMPQAPAFAAPALPQQPPTLGDKLVSFLPFMLALTVINFLGMLAVLIILFATRK